MGKHGNGIGSGYSTLSYHLLYDEQVVFDCPFQLGGHGEEGLYTVNANVGNTTGAVIIAFNVVDVPDRAIWTYDGQSASEYSSPNHGYLQDLIGTIDRDCGFDNANGSGATTYTNAGNYYYDADSQQFEIVDQVGVSLNGGNPYSAAQVNLTPTRVGWAIMVVPKPNLTPAALDVVVEGPCNGTRWGINIECPRHLQARPASQVNCNGIKMDEDVVIESSLNQLDLSETTTSLGISVGTYVFGKFIPDGTTVASIESSNEITLSAPATQSVSNQKITFSDSIAYFVDVSYKDGNTVGSETFDTSNRDFNVEVHDWVYADSSAVNSISGDWYISKNQYTQLDLVKMNYANDVVTSFEVCDPPCVLTSTCTTSHVVVGDKIRFTVMCGGNNVTTSIGNVGIIDLPGSGYSSNGPHSGTYIELDLPPDGEYTLVIFDATYGCQFGIGYDFVLGTGGCRIPYAGNYNPNATFSLNSTCTCPTWTPTVVVNSNATNSNGDGSSFTVTWNMPAAWSNTINGVVVPSPFSYIIYDAVTNIPVNSASIGFYNTPEDDQNMTSKTFTNFEPGSYYVHSYIIGLGGEENCYSNNANITISEIPEVSGCMDPNANNYDPNATISDGSCDYSDVLGCMDPEADNYNPMATISDGSCTYCDDFSALLIAANNPTNGCNGSISATGTGGSSNYSFSVYDENGVPVNPFALCTGTFDVVVSDAEYGCSETISVTLT